MPILTISGVPYNYPTNLQEAGWGEDATGWAQAVTDMLSALVANGDILPSTNAIQNNITTLTNIDGMFFNSDIVRSARIDYSVYRVSDTTPSGVVESGMMLIALNDTAPVGQKWSITQYKNGDSGVQFTLLDSGQVQYKSSDVGITNYTGNIKFTAKVLNK